MDQLLRRAGTTVEDVGDVELIRRAAREQDRVAEGSVHRVGEDLGREHPRPTGDAGDVARLRAEEPLDHVVEEGAVLRRDGGLDERVELGVEAGEQVGVEEVLDDDGAVALERVDQDLGGCVRREPLDVHDPTLGRDRGRYPENRQITGLIGFDIGAGFRTCDPSCSDSLNGAQTTTANQQFALAA